MISYYIRCSTGSTLVRIPESGLSELEKAHMAIEEAKEQGCLPEQSKAGDQVGVPFVIYQVVEQADEWYNRLFTEEEARAIRQDAAVVEGIR